MTDELLTRLSQTGRFSFGHPSVVHIVDGGARALFLRGGPESPVNDLWEIDLDTGAERVLATAESLSGARELTPEERAQLDRTRTARRGITTYQVSRDGERLLVPLTGHLYLIDRTDGRSQITELASEDGRAVGPQLSPDGSSVAYVRAGNVFVASPDQPARRLTERDGRTDIWGLAEFVAQEEMGRHKGFWWSPDAQTLLIQHTENRGVETLWLHDPKSPQSQPRPQRYPRAGTANADVSLALFAADGSARVPVQWDKAAYPYLASVIWQEGAPLTLVVQDRAQRTSVIMTVDVSTGLTTPIQTETDAAWLNLDQSVPRWLSDGSAYLWSTERSGRWTLELRGANGNLIREVLGPDAGYDRLLAIDEGRDTVYFRSRHKPMEGHVGRAPLSGGTITWLTTTPGDHHASVTVRDAGAIWVRYTDGADGTREATIHRPDGERAIVSRSATPPWLPRLDRLEVTCAAGTCSAGIVRPRHFVPGRKYPVFVYVYGGPHHQVITAEPRRYFMHQWMADHGAIVAMIDGRGTPARGRDWERAIAGDVSTGPIADQVSGLKALAEKVPEMDLERVAVFGWSFGGYMTQMLVLRHPELYKVGVAGAPVTDWTDYDTHYTERYMGMPAENPKGYETANVLTWADKLSRPLMLMHGTVDDNVYPVHTFKASDAYFRAGKAHTVVPLAGFTHHVSGALPTRRLWETMVGFMLDGLPRAEAP